MSKRVLLGLFLVTGIIVGPALAQSLVPIDPATVTDGHAYLMDNIGADVPDDSANSNNGNLLGSPQSVAGLNGEALQLNGVDDGVHLPDATAINTSTHQNHTVIAVFNCADVTKTAKQCVYEEGGSTRGLVIYVHEGLAYAGAWNRADYTPQWNPGTWFSAPIGSNEWHVVAAVLRDGGAAQEEDKFEVWMDGELIGKGPGGQLQGRSDDNGIGNVQAQTNFHDETVNAGHWFEGTIDEVWILNQALSEAELAAIGFAKTIAQNPVPANEAVDVPRDDDLAWDPGEFAQTHDVYLGTAFDDVNTADRASPMDLLLSEGQAGTAFDPGRLEFGQTYYWRVDEVNAAPDNTIYKGEVWSFEVEPLAYPVANIVATATSTHQDAGPENTVNGSGLAADGSHSVKTEDMWLSDEGDAGSVSIQYTFDQLYKLHEMRVWNYNIEFEPFLGYGFKNVTVEYSENGVDWMVLGDFEFAQAASNAGYTANTMVPFDGLAVQAVRLTANSNWGGVYAQYGLSEVHFMYIPVSARQPQPADGASGVDVNAALAWRAGREAHAHEVYLGTDPNDLALIESTNDTTALPMLEFGTDYTWMVNEVNDLETPSAWAGPLWSFQTQEYATIDDFESYDDEDNVIYETWLDGWVNGTASIVGYFEAPFAEKSIVHTGGQSMPLQYDNSLSPFYSEAEKDLGGLALDASGATALRLFVAGQAPPYVASDSTIAMSAIGTDIWGTADQFRYAYMSLSGDGAIVARVDGIYRSNEWVKGGVMIRESTEPGAPFAAVYLTGDYGVRYQARLESDVDAVSDSSVVTDEQVALQGPVWVKIERVGNDFNGYYSTDGETWTTLVWSPQTIAMGSDVTIGIALTSHDAAISTGGTFSGIATTGGVSGAWEMAEIGVAQPTAAGNDIEPLYVALEDAGGNVAVVTNPNPAAVGNPAWQEWLIPYSELTGINLSNVSTMFIGVGDRNNPTSGGAGTVFIDDISFGKPAAE